MMRVSPRSCLPLFGLFLAAASAVSAQEPTLEEMLPGMKDRAVVVNMETRVVEQNQEVSYDTAHRKVTIPGRPVGLKIVGENLAIVVQFTPYFYRDGRKVLVAQGQIWLNVPGEGMHYQTTLETIPLEFAEPIYFFPLGSAEGGGESKIEIKVEMLPYSSDLPAANAPSNSPERR